MVNMLKVQIAVFVLLLIVGYALLGKKVLKLYILKTANTTSNESVWMEAIAGILTLSIAIVYYWQQEPAAAWYMWTGVLITFIGGLLLIIARKQLHEETTLEERLHSGFQAAQLGLYGRIRHPNKAALLLLLFGICLSTGSFWALGIFVVFFIPSLLYRLYQEEQALEEQFGERWIDYKADTKRLIPKVF